MSNEDTQIIENNKSKSIETDLPDIEALDDSLPEVKLDDSLPEVKLPTRPEEESDNQTDDDECTVDNPMPCKLKVGVGLAIATCLHLKDDSIDCSSLKDDFINKKKTAEEVFKVLLSSKSLSEKNRSDLNELTQLMGLEL